MRIKDLCNLKFEAMGLARGTKKVELTGLWEWILKIARNILEFCPF